MRIVKCPNCKRDYYLEKNPVCPYCGADHPKHAYGMNENPKTISQLKTWSEDNELPDEEVTQLFIDENCNEPDAFGVYEENGEFIVYKNKPDGSKVIHYKGPNEAFATKWLYTRLKKFVPKQEKKVSSSEQVNRSSERSAEKEANSYKSIICFILIPIVLILIVAIGNAGNSASLYKSNQPQELEYYRDAQGNFYHMDTPGLDTCNWYVLDADTGEWSLYASFDDTVFPENLDNSRITDTFTIQKETGLDYDDFYFYKSDAYYENHR